MIKGETVLSGAKGADRDPHVSEFQVLRSGAGWYVGTIYTHCGECPACLEEDMPKGFQEPNTRETGYFSTEAAAQEALKAFVEHGAMPAQRKGGYLPQKD